MTQIKEPDLKTKIISIIADQLSVNIDEVEADYHLVDDLGADSLDTVEMLMELEEEFGISISDEEAEELTTVQSVIDYISEHS